MVPLRTFLDPCPFGCLTNTDSSPGTPSETLCSRSQKLAHHHATVPRAGTEAQVAVILFPCSSFICPLLSRVPWDASLHPSLGMISLILTRVLVTCGAYADHAWVISKHDKFILFCSVSSWPQTPLDPMVLG